MHVCSCVSVAQGVCLCAEWMFRNPFFVSFGFITLDFVRLTWVSNRGSEILKPSLQMHANNWICPFNFQFFSLISSDPLDSNKQIWPSKNQTVDFGLPNPKLCTLSWYASFRTVTSCCLYMHTTKSERKKEFTENIIKS